MALACSGRTTESKEGSDSSSSSLDSGDTDTGVDETPLSPRFTMAVIADPHVIGPGDHETRLSAAVDWINAHASQHDIQLVVVLGDICWGDGFELAHDAISRLTMPWVPVMGDNVIQDRREDIFHGTFDDQLELLASQVENFEIQPTPVFNPERERDSWLQNIGFDFSGIRFLSVDWNSREYDSLWGETPDLHDFDGGTWPWLVSELDSLGDRPLNSVILLSHMPLFEGIGGLTAIEADKVVEAFYPQSDKIWANLAGHLHWSNSNDWTRAGIEVHVTDATWDDENTVRLIHVEGNENRFAYTHELIEIP